MRKLKDLEISFINNVVGKNLVVFGVLMNTIILVLLHQI